jgi:beta-glucanase (GH16 family)
MGQQVGKATTHLGQQYNLSVQLRNIETQVDYPLDNPISQDAPLVIKEGAVLDFNFYDPVDAVVITGTGGKLHTLKNIRLLAGTGEYEEIKEQNLGTLDPKQPSSRMPTRVDGYVLYWNDEFNGTGSPDSGKWNFERGFARNEELQWYQTDNATCGEGILTIAGRKERVPNPNYEAGSSDWKRNRQYAEYTSSSITTSGGKMHFKFGRIEVRAKIPTAKGAWPAIWTLGEWWEWPTNGEIDILEYYISGGVPKILINWAWGSNTRWSGQWNSWSRPLSDFTKDDPEWASKFHTWMMDWERDKMSIYIDGVCWREVANTMTNPASFGSDQCTGQNPFYNYHYVLLNLALGANGGDPSGSTFPMKYEIDYVRVYQKK